MGLMTRVGECIEQDLTSMGFPKPAMKLSQKDSRLLITDPLLLIRSSLHLELETDGS